MDIVDCMVGAGKKRRKAKVKLIDVRERVYYSPVSDTIHSFRVLLYPELSKMDYIFIGFL
jgi:hypothetical protein